MPIQTQNQLIARANEIRTETREYDITEQEVGQLLIDIVETAFANIPAGLTPAQVKALLLQNADTNNLSDALLEKLNNVPANTTTALSGKENTGVAQGLIDGLKDGVSFSGDTLNKLYNLIANVSAGLNTKVSTGDTRLSDQRTPINDSVSTVKIQDSAVTEVKLASEVRDKLNQVSGATGYNSASFDGDFAEKTTDQLVQGLVNLYFTSAEKNKLAGIESGATRDQTAAEIETAYESRPDTNKYTDSDKSKVDNLPSNTTTALAGKENTGVAQTLIDGLKDNVSSSGDTLNKLYALISSLTVGLNTKVSTGDTRLSDQRTPINNSVSTAKIQDGAVTNDKITSGITIDKFSTSVQSTLNSVANKENTGVAQGLIDNLKASVPASGDTLNKLYTLISGNTVGLGTKVSTGDARLTDERTPIDDSVSTGKIADGAVTNAKIANDTIEEVKLSGSVRDKLNQVSGATGYNSASFNSDFSGKTTDDLQQGASNLYLTDNSVDADKIQDGVIGKVKLSTELQDELNSLTGATGYNSSDFNTDFSGKTTDELTEGAVNLYLTGDEKTKLANVPENTIEELSTKISTDDTRLSDERTPVDDSVSTVKIQDGAVTNEKIASGITIDKFSTTVQDTLNSVALKEDAGTAQTLIDALKGGVPISGNTLNKLNTLISQSTQTIDSKEDVGVAQTLIDNLKDNVSSSGDTLNKLYSLISGNTVGLSTKVSTGDSRLSDERVPTDDSVSTVKIQDYSVSEIKLSSEVQQKLNLQNVIDGGNAFTDDDDLIIDGGSAFD